MSKRTIIIGAGINGLVAANYLARSGCDVTILEKKNTVGGACTFQNFSFGDIQVPIPTGASVFGMMQDFVYQETGLSDFIKIYQPQHSSLCYFGNDQNPVLGSQLTNERFEQDLARIRNFLIEGYRQASPPKWENAIKQLGVENSNRWVSGSALELLNYYFQDDRSKIYKSMAVTESGPVPLDSPTSAFNIAALSSGNVFSGDWGFVLGGLWQLPLKLAELNEKLGVKIHTSVSLSDLDSLEADAIFLATDPITAAQLTKNQDLIGLMSEKKFLGSSGKIVMVFREPIRWKGDTGEIDFDCAFRFFYHSDSFTHFQESNLKIREGNYDYSPSSMQIYCEGAGMRKMGWKANYDYFSVFFKDLGLREKGSNLPEIKHQVIQSLLPRLENPESFSGAVLFTPKDLQQTFYFPQGNIDHMELCEGQNFSARTFSSDPDNAFYQFGNLKNVFYCGSGSYPCGSVAGTAGYLCARQWLG